MRSPATIPPRTSAALPSAPQQRARASWPTSPAYGLPWSAAPSSVAVAAAASTWRPNPPRASGDAERGDAELGQLGPAGPPRRIGGGQRVGAGRLRGRRRRHRGAGGCRRSWPWRSGSLRSAEVDFGVSFDSVLARGDERQPGTGACRTRSSTSTTTTTRPRTPSPGTRTRRLRNRGVRWAEIDGRRAHPHRRQGELVHREPHLRPGGQAGLALRLVPRQPEAADDRRGVR